jgi:hypothetical protein
MKAIVGLLMAATLAFGSGCAKQDWIDRTLVTVDVTGTWYGSPPGAGYGQPGDFLLELKQKGSAVTGFLRSGTSQGTSNTGPLSGPITGTVAADVFSFRDARGAVEGELTVSGDEMSGTVSVAGVRRLYLRRIDPSSPPVSPPR